MSRSRLSVLSLLVLAACADPTDAAIGAEEHALGASAPAALPGFAVADLASACPPARGDALCTTLRDATEASGPAAAAELYRQAGRIIAARVAAGPRASVLADPAVRWWVRERVVALTAWNAAPDAGDAWLEAHFPAYPAAAFPIARTALAPDVRTTSCARPTEALVIFVGVLRSGNRQEFDRQAAALRNTFPCLHVARVEYDSFVASGPNAALARELVARIDAELGPVPLHFVGYSQGVTNALRTLVDYPEIAARTRTLVSLNSAAHGSETADASLAALPLAEDRDATCDDLPRFAREACAEAIAGLAGQPIPAFLHTGLGSLGFDTTHLDETTVGAFLRARIAGLRSLSTAETAAFWRERGAALPKDTLYLSFRSAILDPAANLPLSNSWSYLLLAGIDPAASENDMQVRLVNQALAGPVASVEVVGPVAEGNHWQWELTSNDLPELLEPAAMAERMPHEALFLGYYQALHEIGLVVP